MKYVLMALIRVYQWTVSPLIGPVCRFYPSCSHYGYEAIARHGAVYGTYLTARRLMRCHPWNPGGVDLVPEKSDRPWWAGVARSVQMIVWPARRLPDDPAVDRPDDTAIGLTTETPSSKTPTGETPTSETSTTERPTTKTRPRRQPQPATPHQPPQGA